MSSQQEENQRFWDNLKQQEKQSQQRTGQGTGMTKEEQDSYVAWKRNNGYADSRDKLEEWQAWRREEERKYREMRQREEENQRRWRQEQQQQYQSWEQKHQQQQQQYGRQQQQQYGRQQQQQQYGQQQQQQYGQQQEQRDVNGETYYSILGLSANATQLEIKKAYRALALANHPDKNNTTEAEALFRKVNGANEILSNVNAKQEYDRYLRAGLGHKQAAELAEKVNLRTGGKKKSIRMKKSKKMNKSAKSKKIRNKIKNK